MSYTRINGMRSARYPLQGMGGCGCGCSGTGSCHGVGSLTDTLGGGAVVAVIGLGTLAALWWGLGAPKRRVSSNRRRRRR